LAWVVPVVEEVLLYAEQLAGVPPLPLVQLQLQGPLPVMPDAVPLVQRSVVGATVNVPPLLVPHELPDVPVTVAINDTSSTLNLVGFVESVATRKSSRMACPLYAVTSY
jgi:hypothetical protein